MWILKTAKRFCVTLLFLFQHSTPPTVLGSAKLKVVRRNGESISGQCWAQAPSCLPYGVSMPLSPHSQGTSHIAQASTVTSNVADLCCGSFFFIRLMSARLIARVAGGSALGVLEEAPPSPPPPLGLCIAPPHARKPTHKQWLLR